MDCATDACCALLGMENTTAPDESPIVVESKRLSRIISADEGNDDNSDNHKENKLKQTGAEDGDAAVVEVVTEEDNAAGSSAVAEEKDHSRIRRGDSPDHDSVTTDVVMPSAQRPPPSADIAAQTSNLRGISSSRSQTPPSSAENSSSSNSQQLPSSQQQHELSLLELASAEIERIRQRMNRTKCHSNTNGSISSNNNNNEVFLFKFPPACLALCKSLSGNGCCVDCGARRPEWAAVSYGALLCLKCSGHHRSLGVQVSQVRSLAMDEFSLPQLIALLEGGNAQWTHFLERHHLTTRSCRTNHSHNNGSNANSSITKQNVVQLRYKTKAAQFYRQQMTLHIARILQQTGHYRGRTLGSRRHSHRTLDQRNSTVE